MPLSILVILGEPEFTVFRKELKYLRRPFYSRFRDIKNCPSELRRNEGSNPIFLVWGAKWESPITHGTVYSVSCVRSPELVLVMSFLRAEISFGKLSGCLCVCNVKG